MKLYLLAARAREDFFILEEALNLNLRAFRRVGGMADIDGNVFGKVSANGSGSGFCRIGGTKNVSYFGDRVFSIQGKSDDGAAGHVFEEAGEYPFAINNQIKNMGVMFRQDRRVQLHHLDPANTKTVLLKARQAFSDDVFLYGIGLEEY